MTYEKSRKIKKHERTDALFGKKENKNE